MRRGVFVGCGRASRLTEPEYAEINGLRTQEVMTSDGINIVDLPVAFVKICRAFMELLSSIADADRKLSVCVLRWCLWRCVGYSKYIQWAWIVSSILTVK
jgi:hypothetical protein